MVGVAAHLRPWPVTGGDVAATMTELAVGPGDTVARDAAVQTRDAQIAQVDVDIPKLYRLVT